jgi:hypothetical protein
MPSSSRSEVTFFVAITAVAVLLVLGAYAYCRYAAYVPTFAPQLPPMPEPNGYVRAEQAVLRLSRGDQLRRPTIPKSWPNGAPAELGAQVTALRPVLDEVRAAFKLEWRQPPQLDAAGIRRWSADEEFRECACGFVAESHLAESQGDLSLAMQRSLDAIELGSNVPRGGGISQSQVGLAIHAIGYAGAGRLTPELPAGAIPPALARVRRLRAGWPPLSDMWKSERVERLVLVREVFRRLGACPPLQQLDWFRSAQSNPSVWGTFQLAATPRSLSLANVDRNFQQLIAESRKPFPQRRAIAPPQDAWSVVWGGIVDVDPEQAWRYECPQTQLALLEVALAVRLHFLQLQRYPTRLAEIDRHWLPAVPRDLWGQPIAYRRIAGKPQIYSLGPDGKDDGGQPLDTFRLEPASRGDVAFRWDNSNHALQSPGQEVSVQY